MKVGARRSLAPLQATIATDNLHLARPAIDTSHTGVTYSATVGCGKGAYAYSWTVGGANIASACGDNATCLLDFATGHFCSVITVAVNVDDADICAAKDSEIETATKTTNVTATNKPAR